MLGFFPVKSVASRDKIGYVKGKLAEMQQKEKLERILNIDNDNIFLTVTHISVPFFK